MKQQKYLITNSRSDDEWLMVDIDIDLEKEGYIANGETVYLVTIEKKFEVVEEKKLKLEEIKIK